ncbi:MAG: hypothetical protein JXM69_17975 [Anaerolineae bacterium]|nr:hypothetical protein [Anaerolineae bacterium]
MAQPEANIEITVTGKNGGPPLLHERLAINRDLALEFVQQMAAMVKTLPGQHQLTHVTDEAGKTVVEITLNKRSPPPPVDPSFADLFKHKQNRDLPEKER